MITIIYRPEKGVGGTRALAHSICQPSPSFIVKKARLTPSSGLTRPIAPVQIGAEQTFFEFSSMSARHANWPGEEFTGTLQNADGCCLHIDVDDNDFREMPY